MTKVVTTLKDFFKHSGLPLLESRMLVEEVMRVNRAWMMTHDDEPLAIEHLYKLNELVKRRLAGEPMAYILGYREFMGLNLKVSPAVLIPRPDTETLVEQALQFLKNKPNPSVLDMGTGSGAIAISIAHYAPHAEVWACDISLDALSIARDNASTLKLNINFLSSDWFSAFDKQRFDLIVSNPPYIHQDDEHLEQGDLRFEPSIALTDFADGLSCYRTIIEQAPHYLKADGALWLEHGYDQAAELRGQLIDRGFSGVCSLQDLAGIERVSGGFWRA